MQVLRKIKIILLKRGFKVLIIRLYRKLYSTLRNFYVFSLDRFNLLNCSIKFERQLSINRILEHADLVKNQSKIDQDIISNFLSHRFDLLGSGWTSVKYGAQCRGLDGISYEPYPKILIDNDGKWLNGRLRKSHLEYSKRVWTCVDSGYTPIDWQLDFKSGYRWSEKTWYKSIKHGEHEAVDIKVPWELSRMQHLPLLAREFLSPSLSYEGKNKLVNEFRNQILDFIATNPLRHGVNWACPMDISIRASNWLLAYDIFCSQGYIFDEDFKHHFKMSIYYHGKHIVNNLEWNHGKRANHYLSNISGLAFIACYLSTSKELDGWLSFSIQQLLAEVDHQFFDEGTNFEGSTAYHCLSSEMVFFTTCILLGIHADRLLSLRKTKLGLFGSIRNKSSEALEIYNLKDEEIYTKQPSPFSEDYFKKLASMSNFMKDITKPDGSFPQIGDNDSGRFFKLSPLYEVMRLSEAKNKYSNLSDYSEMGDEENYHLERVLNSNHIQDISNAVFTNSTKENVSETYPDKSFDYLIACSLSRNSKVQFKETTELQELNRNILFSSLNFDQYKETLSNPIKDPSIKIFKTVNSLKDNFSCHSYPEFGLYVFKSNSFYLSIRSWSGIPSSYSGHMHFDQLSIELSIEGKNVISDPGSYIYTPFPKKRWVYRSADSHFSPFFDLNIPSEIQNNPFSEIELIPVEVIYFGSEGFLANYEYNGLQQYYYISLEDNQVYIEASKLDQRQLEKNHEINLSSGYGVSLK